MGMVCRLLAGEGHGNLHPRNFITLDRFKRSWLATTAAIWNGLPANVTLQGEASGWCTISKGLQCCIWT